MKYVQIPNKWKQFIYHMGRARDLFSIAESGLVAGGKESKERRQTIFFTSLDPYQSDASEAETFTDLSKPRKVHYQTHWRPEQDAVYWVNLSRARDSGPKFWQTQSHAIIVHQSVPKECVEKVVTEKGGQQLFARQLTPRPGPKVTFRNCWWNQIRAPPTCFGKPMLVMWSWQIKSWILQRAVFVPVKKGEQNSGVSMSSVAGNRVSNDQTMLQIDLRVNGILSDEIYEDEQHMQSITKQIEKLADTENSLREEPLQNNILSEEVAMNIYEAGNFASYTKFNKEPSKCNDSVADHSWKLDSKCARVEESFIWQKRRFPAWDENFTNSSRTPIICRVRNRADINMVFFHFKNIIDEPMNWRTRSDEKGSTLQFLPLPTGRNFSWKSTCSWLDWSMVQIYRLCSEHWHLAPSSTRTKKSKNELYHFRYGSEESNPKTMKARPDYQMATSAIKSVNQEAVLKRQSMLKSNKARNDLDPQKRNWLIWLSQNWETYFADNRHTATWSSSQWYHNERLGVCLYGELRALQRMECMDRWTVSSDERRGASDPEGRG